MKASWQREANRLVCHWSETGLPAGYTPPWMRTAEASAQPKSVPPAFLDFTRLSPFAARGWYSPGGSAAFSGSRTR